MKKGSSASAGKLAETVGIDRPFWAPNRIGTYISNDGALVDKNGAGLEWPVGSGNFVIFQSGIWLAGIKNSEIVTAVSEFSSEFQPGVVTGWSPGVAGTAADSQNNRFHVYIIDEEDPANPSRNDDYANWPVGDGAPVDENGEPLLLGTSTAWAVSNDFDQSLHDNLFQSKVMGVELQMTTWAFDRISALGDMMFFKFKFINKSGQDITDAFAAIWADIDIGDASDLVGYDTTLSLGYMYKTQLDGLYGDNPPAIGYDFFHGPVVPSPGDTAIVSGQKRPGFKNLPVTTFPPQLKNSAHFSDPENALEVYNYMRGIDEFDKPLVDPETGQIAKFWATGDPVAGTGWLDEKAHDKRILLASGPFHFADGDTQEVVGGIVIAQGETGLQSVELMRQNDHLAQVAYEFGFAIPKSPPAPTVGVSTDTTSIFLSWNDTVEKYSEIDQLNRDKNDNPAVYFFQGYNIYQLNDPDIVIGNNMTRIASFDLIDGIIKIRDDVFDPETGDIANRLVQDAQDTGLQRFLRITQDTTSGNTPLVQNHEYYFAVTAYIYSPSSIPKILESPLQIISARPHSPPLGSRLTTEFGEVLDVIHNGNSDGFLVPIIVDPLSLSNQEYKVRFRKNVDGEIIWDVVVDEVIKIQGWNNQGERGQNDYPIVDGVLVQVIGPHLGINTVAREFEGGPRWVSGTSWGGSHLFGGMDMGSNFLDFGSTLGSVDHVTVDWRFTSNATMSEQTGWSRAYVYRRDSDNAFAGLGWIPCQMYDVTDEANPRQLNICFVEDGVEGFADGIWNPISAESAGGGSGGYEYLFCMLSDYNPDVGLYDDDNFGPSEDVLFALWPKNRGSHPYQESDFTMRITPNFANTERDTFRFKSEAPVRNNLVLAKQQAAALINVFPNPYNRGIINIQSSFDQFVTFTHLPETYTVIRIFSLSGDLVRKIEHDNGTQFDFWDLRNAADKSVSSGFYIVHIDMGEIGVKVLKLVVL